MYVQELVWQSERFGAATLSRRKGQRATLSGPAAELPMRVAAQQLAAIASMSQKVRRPPRLAATPSDLHKPDHNCTTVASSNHGKFLKQRN